MNKHTKIQQTKLDSKEFINSALKILFAYNPLEITPNIKYLYKEVDLFYLLDKK
jgi:hypothetical protein